MRPTPLAQIVPAVLRAHAPAAKSARSASPALTGFAAIAKAMRERAAAPSVPVAPHVTVRELREAGPRYFVERDLVERGAMERERGPRRRDPAAEAEREGAPLVPLAPEALSVAASPVGVGSSAPPPAHLDPTFHAMALELLDKAAFHGDGTRGVARLRFAGKARGGLGGATVTLEHDGAELRLRIEGADAATEEYLRERLAKRGLTVE